MIEERINIVPILAANISEDGSDISKQFDEITIKKGAKGEFYIDFITNAIINEKYSIKYILVRKIDDGVQALYIDSFIIPPSKEFLDSRRAKQKEVESNWSFGNGQIIFGHTKAKMNYDTINKSGEYGILAFAKKIDNDSDEIDEFELSPNNLICERHFFVSIEE